MRYFVVVAEELHFSRAAQRLGIAQPALSQQIAAIERAIGGPLFVRKPAVALTPAGQVFLDQARATIAQFDRAVSAAARVAIGEAGPLVIGFAASAILTRVTDILHDFRVRFPDVTLDLKELSPAQETEAVLAGLVDVAFVREIAAHPELRYHDVVREPFVVLVPQDHHLGGCTTVEARQLAAEGFVHFPRDTAPSLYDHIATICREARFAPQVTQYTREWLTELSLVNAGVGIAIVPASVGELAPAGVRVIPIVGTRVTGAIALCHRRSNLAAVVDTFVRMTHSAIHCGEEGER